MTVCEQCGGLQSTEPMEMIAGTPCRCGVDYCCADWVPQIEKINGPIVLQSLRAGRDCYKEAGGIPFRYCPWCGKAR